MDFTPDPAQQAVADVVTTVLDRDNTWDALVSGGVTALGVPERLGGDGVGLPEIATALTEIGRHGTISPALATLGLGLIPLLDLADEAQQDRFLDGVAKGAILTAALNEPGAALPDRPATTLAGGRLNGTKVAVPYAEQASWMLVTTDSGVVVVSPEADGVRLTKTPSSTGGEEYAVDVHRRGRRCRRGARGRDRAPGQPVGAGRRRRVRGRTGGRRGPAHRRLCGQPPPVRQAAVHLPDGGRAAGRGLHRLAHTGSGVDVGDLAAGRRPRRRRRSRRAGLLADLAGAAGDADLPSPARRHGYGHHLPHAPLLLLDQGPDPPAGRPAHRLDLVGAQCTSN